MDIIIRVSLLSIHTKKEKKIVYQQFLLINILISIFFTYLSGLKLKLIKNKFIWLGFRYVFGPLNAFDKARKSLTIYLLNTKYSQKF